MFATSGERRNTQERMKLLGALVLIVSICGCERSAYDHLAQARHDLSDTAYDTSVASADAGLRRDPDEVTAWGLEIVKLEALARAGRAEETKAQLDKLASTHPNRIPASQYSATAQQLRTAGQGAAAIEVLDVGVKLFPYDPVIARMLGDSSAGSDPAELEMLRSLGYVE